MDELVKRLRELQTITEHCDEQSCDECENRELCDKHDNKTLSGTYKEAADAIEGLQQIANKLLEKYQEEATSVIWEYSGNIAEDIDRLNEEVRILMAQINGMPLPQPPKEET